MKLRDLRSTGLKSKAGTSDCEVEFAFDFMTMGLVEFMELC